MSEGQCNGTAQTASCSGYQSHLVGKFKAGELSVASYHKTEGQSLQLAHRPEISLPLVSLGITAASLLHRLHFGNLGDGHVPPGIVSGHTIVVVSLNHDNRSLRLTLRGCEGLSQLVVGLGLHRISAKAGGIRRKIYLDGFTGLSLVPVSILGTKPTAATSPTQAADTGEPVIVEQHNVEFHFFLERRDDLLRHHEIRAISDQDIDFTARVCHFHAHSAGDLVAHAGISVLKVVALGIARAPQLVKISREAARGTHNHIFRSQSRVEQSNNLALAERRTDAAGVNSVNFRIPPDTKARDLLGVGSTDMVCAQRLGEFLYGCGRIADQRHCRMFIGVKLSSVEVDEPDFGILKCSDRCGGEIAVASS